MTGIKEYFLDADLLQRNKKNYIKENMKHLKQIEKRHREQIKHEVSQQDALEFARKMSRATRPKRSRKKLSAGDKRSRSSINAKPRSPTTLISLEKVKALRPRSITYKNQGSQTVDDSDDIELSGTFRYPSDKTMENVKKTRRDMEMQTEGRGGGDHIMETTKDLIKEGTVDYVRLNQLTQYKHKNKRENKRDPVKAPPRYQRGVLPKYLREQKSCTGTNIREQSPVKDDDKEEECFDRGDRGSPQRLESPPQEKDGGTKKDGPPPGHVLLSEPERREQLKQMRKHYADLVYKLKTMPRQSDSLKAKQRRNEIEKELEKLEAGIKLFSQENLYVKIS